MIKLACQIPQNVHIAVSGGPDSMVLLDFVMRGRRGTSNDRTITVVHYNHGSTHSDEAEAFVTQYCTEHSLPLIVDRNEGPAKAPPGVSQEEYWRNQRYSFFNKIEGDLLMAHTLDDAVETWVFSSLHGRGYVIPAIRDNIRRPLILTKREQIMEWAERHDVPFVEDPSNAFTDFMRNYIRHHMMPHVKHVNPGIYKVVAKKYACL